MTERALLVKHAFSPDGRYVAVGIEHPSARVFDVATGALVAECAVEGHRNMVLSAIALGNGSQGTTLPNLAIGTENGRVLVHDCARDETVANTTIADAATPITGLAFTGSHLLILSAGGRIAVARAATGAVITSKLRTVKQASSIAVVPDATSPNTVTVVVTSVAACAALKVTLPPVTGGEAASSASLDETCRFSGHVAAPDASAIVAGGAGCITASFSDGVLRLWDLRPSTAVSGAGDARCRAFMPCGHRIVALHVVEHATSNSDGAATSVTAVATTITGEALVFAIDAQRLVTSSANAGSTPTLPVASLASASPGGRMLAVSPSLSADGASVSLVCIRGRWSVPAFENVGASTVAEAALRRKKASARGVGHASGTAALKVPFKDTAKASTAGPDHIVLNKKKVRRQAMLEEHGAVVDAAMYDEATVPMSKSVSDLPVSVGGGVVKSRAQIDEDAAATAAADDAHDAAIQADAEATTSGTGGVVVLLHQALHASDAGMVAELIIAASRSASDMVATIRSLQLPYLAQLLRIVAQRLVTAGTASPLHGWVHCTLRERGPEIRRVIAAADDEGASDEDKVLGAAFKSILSPVLERYRRLTAVQSSLSVIHGRSSVFLGTRAAKGRPAFLNVHKESSRAYSQKLVRMSLPKGALGLSHEDLGEESRTAPASARRRRRAQHRATEALLADEDASDFDDDDDALLQGRGRAKGRGLDDAEDSDEFGDDDDSQAIDGRDDYNDEDDDEDIDFDDEDDEEGDGDDFDDELSLDDEALAGLGDVEEDEEDDADLAPSDDLGSARGSRDRDDHDDDGDDDSSVVYEEAEEGAGDDDDDDEALALAAGHDRHSRQLTLDGDDYDDDDA